MSNYGINCYWLILISDIYCFVYLCIYGYICILYFIILFVSVILFIENYNFYKFNMNIM